MTEQQNEEELVASEKTESEEQTVDNTTAETNSTEPKEPSGCCGSCS